MLRKYNLRSLTNSFQDNFRLPFIFIYKSSRRSVCTATVKVHRTATIEHLFGCLRICFVTFPSVFLDTPIPNKNETVVQLSIKTCPSSSFAEIRICKFVSLLCDSGLWSKICMYRLRYLITSLTPASGIGLINLLKNNTLVSRNFQF